MEALSQLGAKVNELLTSLQSASINGQQFGATDFAVSNYLIFLFVAIVILTVVIFVAVRRLSLVPRGRLVGSVEALAEWVRNDIAIQLLGPEDGKKYFPFIATVFFFILMNNVLGLIPGARPGTGTMGVTVALSTTVFVYFNVVGVKRQGAAGYFKSFAPQGVPKPINYIINPVVWFIEVFSACLRIFTLAVRLFANMFAGHLILGIFATLTALFAEPLVNAILHGGHPIGAAAIGALPSIGWLLLMTALYVLEVVVAFVQAYVFTMLTTVYISLAAHAH